MYQLISAIVKPLSGHGRWSGMDIGNVALRDLFNSFKYVIATLSNSVLTANVSLDIESMRATWGGSALSFNDFLVQNANKTLPTSNEISLINTRYANYSDAVRAGYKLTPTHPSISSTSQLSINDKTHALMTKLGADYELIYKNCLINVNGFYHQTDYSTEGLFITDAMKSVELCGRNEVGILSFLKLGELSFIQITDDMIYSHSTNESLKSNCYINTGIDLSTKTVMLVLGGYLHVLDERCMFRVSPSSFGLDFNEIPLLERFFETHGVVDLSSLGLETTVMNPDQVSIQDLFSNAVIRKYLTLSQSFFVVLDNKDIFLDTIPLDMSPFPFNYVSFVEPIYPMVMGRGRHENFWPLKEHDRYSLSVSAGWEGTFNFNTIVTKQARSVANGRIPALGYNNSAAHLLLIGTDI